MPKLQSPRRCIPDFDGPIIGSRDPAPSGESAAVTASGKGIVNRRSPVSLCQNRTSPRSVCGFASVTIVFWSRSMPIITPASAKFAVSAPLATSHNRVESPPPRSVPPSGENARPLTVAGNLWIGFPVAASHR